MWCDSPWDIYIDICVCVCGVSIVFSGTIWYDDEEAMKTAHNAQSRLVLGVGKESEWRSNRKMQQVEICIDLV